MVTNAQRAAQVVSRQRVRDARTLIASGISDGGQNERANYIHGLYADNELYPDVVDEELRDRGGVPSRNPE